MSLSGGQVRAAVNYVRNPPAPGAESLLFFSEGATEQLAPLVNARPARYPHADNTDASSALQIRMFGEVRLETTSYCYNPAHRWYYFPDMTADEVIVFKTHDTDEHRARRVAHTAFDDPGCPPGTPPRASLEARILALFR